MSAVDLLMRLRAYGIELRVVGNELRYRPVDAVPPSLLPTMLQHKRALMALLSADTPEIAERAAAMRARHPRGMRMVPTFTVRDLQRAQGGCISCGEPLDSITDGFMARCRACILAVHLLLAEER